MGAMIRQEFPNLKMNRHSMEQRTGNLDPHHVRSIDLAHKGVDSGLGDEALTVLVELLGDGGTES
jgi:hypothetical protein